MYLKSWQHCKIFQTGKVMAEVVNFMFFSSEISFNEWFMWLLAVIFNPEMDTG